MNTGALHVSAAAHPCSSSFHTHTIVTPLGPATKTVRRLACCATTQDRSSSSNNNSSMAAPPNGRRSNPYSNRLCVATSCGMCNIFTRCARRGKEQEEQEEREEAQEEDAMTPMECLTSTCVFCACPLHDVACYVYCPSFADCFFVGECNDAVLYTGGGGRQLGHAGCNCPHRRCAPTW